MIHVEEQPEPANFDGDVRQKGLANMRRRGIDPNQPLPSGIKLKPCWRECLDDLYASYEGICAYLAVYIVRGTGTASADHFVAKSAQPSLAYEWRNYRLACLAMNRIKNKFEDVLDPFEVENDWFHLELVSGRIYPNPSLDQPLMDSVEKTIKRLKLDEQIHRKMRLEHFLDCINKQVTQNHLRRHSPFVYYEAKRQGLL